MSSTRMSLTCMLGAIIGFFTTASVAKPLNVVMIVSDDQGWRDFGFMDHPQIRTPSIDRLASQSVVWTNGYVTAPLCRPSLASMLTGLHPHQTQIYCNDPPEGVARERTHDDLRRLATIPRLLGKAGYRSLQTGKFWEGDVANGGFTQGMTAEKDRHGGEGLMIGRQGLQPIYDFIEQSGDTPFLVWYAPMMPHDPHTPPERLLRKYKAEGRPDKLAAYWAMCEWFDETCGELLKYLDDHKLADNTLVVFVVDNGWIQETGPVRTTRGWFAPKSKASPYDGGIRTPIMLRWPGRLKPAQRPELVSSIDLAPTILQACGIDPPKDWPGANLLDVIDGKKDIIGRPIFAAAYEHTEVELHKPARSLEYRVVRQGDWKLILPRDGQKPELYNIPADPTEEKNLAAAHPEQVLRLIAMLDRWWKPAE